MNPITVLLMIAGIVLLIVGAEAMVRGASRLAIALGISPLVVGLTVVSFSTGAPELAVGVQSALANQADIALGNVVGSNILNVLIVLGISAIIIPLTVHEQLIRLDVPIMIGASVLVLILGLDGHISRLDGVLLFGGILAYTGMTVYLSRRENKRADTDYEREFSGPRQRDIRSLTLNITLIVIGLLLLVLGSRWMVNGAVEIARFFGISELIIGLTVVAIGTSLPEIVTSIVAAARGERDIAVGNVVGSNIFNIFAVLGLSSLSAPDGIVVSPTALSFDIPVMLVVAVICLPIFFRKYRVERWEGALFVALYIGYTIYLVLAATQSPALSVYSAIMAILVTLTMVIMVVLAIKQLSKTAS
jgi:cation:H+ antiporter